MYLMRSRFDVRVTDAPVDEAKKFLKLGLHAETSLESVRTAGDISRSFPD